MARFGYTNQHGQFRHLKPKFSVYGVEYDPKQPAMDRLGFPSTMTLIERAVERGIVDVWTPQLKLTLTANKNKFYDGAKAVSIWKEWNRRMFKKDKS